MDEMTISDEPTHMRSFTFCGLVWQMCMNIGASP